MVKKFFIVTLIMLFAAALIFGAAGCSKKADEAETETEGVPSYESVGEEKTESSTGTADVSATEAEDGYEPVPVLEEIEASEAMAETDSYAEEGSSSGDEVMPVQQQAGQLTAGEWNDNENFDYFMELLNDNEWYSMLETWGYEDFTRVGVHVISSDYMPVQNAVVRVMDGQENVIYTARTDNKGIAYVFPYLFDKDMEQQLILLIEYEGETAAHELKKADEGRTIDITLQAKAQRSSEVDIMFMIDTTGSMSDELSYIQAELTYIIEEVQKANENSLDIRISTNFYRDTEDDYICRTFEFTSDIAQAITQINAQYANGGGDYPEAVERALYEGISNHDWNENARARIMFLILDAPPHLNSEVLEVIKEQTIAAAQQGIKIIPVASSGVDKSTEFLLRFLETATNGTYVFLTNDSGIGNEHIEPTIGAYDVEYLNDLLVRLINEEIE